MAYEDIAREARNLERRLIRDQISELEAKLADIDARDPEIIEREHDKYVDGFFGTGAGTEAPKTEEEALDRVFGVTAHELTEDEKLDRMFGLDGADELARNNTSAFVSNGALL
ncbi:MAG: hypothetical protein IKG22_04045 [Atopobiaceae bacterium]|nr:hypothetical protein [Atopobiaceae bacterium]